MYNEIVRFQDRKEAGEKLAAALAQSAGKEEAVVYALPRGGVVTGYEVAKKLKAPLDLIIVRKIGHPDSPEYAIGAVAEDGDMILDEAAAAGVSRDWLRQEAERQKAEARRRRETYMGGVSFLPPAGKTAVLVDDGLATGLTMKMAIRELRRGRPRKIIVAVPVAPQDTLDEIAKIADQVVCLYAPPGSFGAVGQYYDFFPQVSDAEVIALLRKT